MDRSSYGFKNFILDGVKWGSLAASTMFTGHYLDQFLSGKDDATPECEFLVSGLMNLPPLPA